MRPYRLRKIQSEKLPREGSFTSLKVPQAVILSAYTNVANVARDKLVLD